MSLCLQCHTLEISHIIKQDEADMLCRIYNLQYSAHIQILKPNIRGINTILINRNPIIKDGVCTRYIHVMTIQINFGRLLNKSNVAMVDLRKSNVQSMIHILDRIFSQKLHLSAQNSYSEKWKLNRLDCGIDLHMGMYNPEVLKFYIRLLHKGFTKNFHCDYVPYKGYNKPEVKSESITIANAAKTYVYNVYLKILEWIKVKNSIPQYEIDEIKDVIRIEKQLKNSKALNELTASPKQLSVLLDENSTFNFMDKIIVAMGKLFGTGIHVTYEKGLQIIKDSFYNPNKKLWLQIIYSNVNKFGYSQTIENLRNLHGWDEKTCKSKMNQWRKQIEALGISIVALPIEDVEQLGCTQLESITDILQKMSNNNHIRKSKGKFGSINFDIKNKRYKCNFSLYDISGKSKRTSVAAQTVRDTEIKILEKLKCNINKNLITCVKDSEKQICYLENIAKRELKNFRTTINDKKMLKRIDDCLNKVDRYIISKKTKINNSLHESM